MMNYKVILSFLFMCVSSFLNAQEVNNIYFEQVGKQIHIYYDLQGEGTYDISVYCSEDDGKSYSDELIYVTGAVGEDQKPDVNKLIVWEVLKEKEKLYGKISFKIEVHSDTTGFFTDPRDGKTYKWVKIEDQIWMAENLNYKQDVNWCYDNKDSNCNKYGRLYNWDTAQKACPNGWHLPSDNEWKTLEMALGMSQSEADNNGWRGIDQSKQLKSSNGWSSGGNGNNNSGFTALPGGYCISSGSSSGLGDCGNWWSLSESSGTHVWYRKLYYASDQVLLVRGIKTVGFSVRCLKN